ncbi:MAG: transporter substrate-binding domain-containing protein [Alphaproteobacteria bacterium]
MTIFMKGAAAAVVCLAVLAFAAPPGSAQEKSKLDEVMARGKLIVGVTSEAPPFGFVDEKGELVGFDIDIARLIAKATFGDANKIDLVRQGFAARWPNVENGTTDFGIQVTTIYADRAQRVAFTRPYIDSGIVVVVKADSAIRKIADLNNAKYTVAHLTAPVQEERGKRLYPQAKFVTYDSIAAQFNAVKLGRADAAQLDAPVAWWYAKDNPDVRILDEWLTDVTSNAVFLRQGDFKWWLYLDTVVAEITGGSLFSQYSAIFQKWFGHPPPHAKYYLNKP